MARPNGFSGKSGPSQATRATAAHSGTRGLSRAAQDGSTEPNGPSALRLPVAAGLQPARLPVAIRVAEPQVRIHPGANPPLERHRSPSRTTGAEPRSGPDTRPDTSRHDYQGFPALPRIIGSSSGAVAPPTREQVA
jgi:hypothetical protein